jgi:NitT/TauT family transport system substrate-binding protein
MDKLRYSHRYLWAGVLLLLAAVGCAPSVPSASPPAAGTAAPKAEAKAAAPTKIRLTQSTAESPGFMPVNAARYFNYFGDEGLAVDVVTTGGGGPEIAAVVAGEAQFTAAGPLNQFALLQEGKRTLSVVSYLDAMVANVLMRKDVYDQKGLSPGSSIEQKIAALKGLKVSISRPGSLTDQVLRSYLRRAGLDPDRDVQIIASTSGQPQIAALEQKAVEAAIITTPGSELAVERGVAVMLIHNAKGEDPFFKRYAGFSIIVMEDYARRNPDTVRAFARAMVKGNQWAREHTPEESGKIMNFYVPSLKVEDAAKSFAYTQHAIPTDGCFTEEGINGSVELFRAAGLLKQEVKWTDIATNEFLPGKCA